MKKLCTLPLVLLCSLSMVVAQIDSVAVTRDSSVTVNRIYAGLLNATGAHVDSFYVENMTSLRFGAQVDYQPTKWLTVKALGALDISSGGAYPASLSQFNARLKGKRGYIQLGQTPQVSTFLHRPLPVDAPGQFETYTVRIIPGGGMGGLFSYRVSTSLDLYGSTVYRNGHFEYQVGMKVAKAKNTLKATTWYSDSTNYGVALSVSTGAFATTTTFNQTVVANSSLLTIKEVWLAYSDVGIDWHTHRLVRGELGLLRTFDTKWVDGLIGLGYSQETKTVRSYLFIHL